MGFEGGIEAPFTKTEQALYSFKAAVGKEDVKIALDIAASEFYKNGKYVFEGRELTRAELLKIYKDKLTSAQREEVEAFIAEADEAIPELFELPE